MKSITDDFLLRVDDFCLVKSDIFDESDETDYQVLMFKFSLLHFKPFKIL